MTESPPPELSDAWTARFEEHGRGLRRVRRILRRLPDDPRCKVCAAPFGGFGARISRSLGRGPSRKNPTICDLCVEAGPDGGFETEGGILFADVRDFTSLAERVSPTNVAELMNRFYAVAAKTLFRHDAIVDKLVGDEVMALFWPPMVDGDAGEEMVAAAEELLHAVGYGSAESPWLELGVGLDFGTAFVGNVGGGELRDFTALGDVVNTAARLQAAAAGGQIVMSERVYEGVAGRFPGAERVDLALKGKAEPVEARIVDLSGEPPVPDEERPSWVEHVEGRVSHDV